MRADFTLQNGAVARVEAVTDDTLRVRFAPSGHAEHVRDLRRDAAGPACSERHAVVDTRTAVYIVGSGFIVGVTNTVSRRRLACRPVELLQADLEPAVSWDTGAASVYTRKWAPPDERYYGFGERGGPLNRRGRTFAMQNKDLAAYGPLCDPLYISIPYFWGARGSAGLRRLPRQPGRAVLQRGRRPERHIPLRCAAGDLDYYLFAGPTPAQVAGPTAT